jgi:hypothetical protein
MMNSAPRSAIMITVAMMLLGTTSGKTEASQTCPKPERC